MVILVLSFISLLATMIGLYYLGEKNEIGFVIFTLSLLCQLYIFSAQENWFLIFQMVVLIIFNLRNFKKWKGDKV